MSRSRILGIFVLFIGVLAMAGVLVYIFVFRADVSQNLKSGEDAYTAGVSAWDSGDAPTAVVKFDQASILASKAATGINNEIKNNPPTTEEERIRLKTLIGRASWLKAIALRDYAFAKRKVDGKPLPEILDSSTGKNFRNLLSIPNPEHLQLALVNIRQAAVSLPDNKEIQREAMRVELQLSPLHWSMVDTISNNLLALDEDNHRALFMKARYFFEQPVTLNDPPGKVTPLILRDRIRAEKALTFLEKAMNADKAPLWRMYDLKAQIHTFLMNKALENRRPEEAKKQADALHELLFGDQGVLAKARDGEDFEKISRWDTDGALNLHETALDLTLREIQQKEAKPAKVKEIVDSTLAFAKKAPDFSKTFTPGELATTSVKILSKAQPYLALDERQVWQQRLNEVKQLAKQAAKVKQGQPAMYIGMAELVGREALLTNGKKDPQKKDKLRAESLQWIKDGLAAAKDNPRIKAEDVLQLHHSAASQKLVFGQKKEELSEHLDVLRKAKTPYSKALILLYEGVLAERAGELDNAREKLEQVLNSESPDLAFRARNILSNVYLTMGQPTKAIPLLRGLEVDFRALDTKSAQERAWAEEFMGKSADITALLVVANLDAAERKAVAFAKKNPKKKIPLDLVDIHEKQAVKRVETLTAPSRQDQAARQSLARYYLKMSKLKEAREEISLLRKEYPNSVEALRLETSLIEIEKRRADPKQNSKLDEKTISEVDDKIQKFIASHRLETAARFLWVTWLLRSDRSDKALDYLKDKANFPGAESNAYNTLLALALLKTGQKEESVKVFRQMEPSPAVLAALIRLESSREKKQEHLNDALSRYQNNGLFICWDASNHFSKGELDKAAERFLSAIDITRSREWAQRGLRESLFAIARKDPSEAISLTSKMLKAHPDETALLAAYAFASMQLDKLGAPADTWERKKNMASALNKWAPRFTQEHPTPGQAFVVKAEFWMLASRPDLARPELIRALARNPDHPRALELAVNLAVTTTDPILLGKCDEFVKKLQELRPESLTPLYLKALVQKASQKPIEAVQTCQAILRKDPKHHGAHSTIITLLEEENQRDLAKQWIDHWRKNVPDNFVAVKAEIRFLCKNNSFAAARKTADDFVAEQMKKIQKQLDEQKRPEDMTEAQFTQAKQKRLADTERGLRLEMCQGFLLGKSWQDVDQRVAQLLQNDPKSMAASLIHAQSYLERKDYKAAQAIYEKVWDESKHKSIVAGNNLAWIMAKTGNDPQKALQIIEEVQRGRFSRKALPGDRLRIEILDTMGLIYHQLDQKDLYPKMRDLFEAGRKRYPRDPRIYLYLGYAYAGLQDTNQARQMYESAIALAKSDTTLSQDTRDEVIANAKKAQSSLAATP